MSKTQSRCKVGRVADIRVSANIGETKQQETICFGWEFACNAAVSIVTVEFSLASLLIN